MTEPNRPDINPDELEKKVGSDMPEREPLELLPEREWLNAHIQDVKYQVAMFNNQVQYVTYKDDNDQDVEVLDDEGKKIMRKEFEFTFIFDDYDMPKGGGKRKGWLRLGSSLGEKAHLPQFLAKVLGRGVAAETPQDIITALKGKEVQLQLKNKLSKDETKTYQNVVWDAVRTVPISAVHEAGPDTPTDPDPLPQTNPSGTEFCKCEGDDRKPVKDAERDVDVCSTCELDMVAWDE